MSEEQLQIFDLLWSQDRPHFEGRYYRFGEVAVNPRPVQQPRFPIWIGGESAPAQRRAARHGDAWFSYFVRINRGRARGSFQAGAAVGRRSGPGTRCGQALFGSADRRDDRARATGCRGPEGHARTARRGAPALRGHRGGAHGAPVPSRSMARAKGADRAIRPGGDPGHAELSDTGMIGQEREAPVMKRAADVPLAYNAVDILERNLDARGGKVALSSADRTMTFGQVSREVNQTWQRPPQEARSPHRRLGRAAVSRSRRVGDVVLRHRQGRRRGRQSQHDGYAPRLLLHPARQPRSGAYRR